VRPVLKYSSPASVWHSSLTVAQSETLDSRQKRALRVIYEDNDNHLTLIVAVIDSLETCREQLTANFFKKQVLDTSCVLNYTVLATPEA